MQDDITTFKCSNGDTKALYIPRSGSLLVMIHGFPGRPQDFKRLIDQLDECSILAVALPGFGISAPSQGITHDSLVQNLIEVIQQCPETEIYVMGHSFGSTLAISVAEQMGDSVSGLFLVSSGPSTTSSHAKWSTVHLSSVSLHATVLAQTANHPCALSPSRFPKKVSFNAMWLSCRLAWTFRFSAYKTNVSQIRVPCTVIHSSDDPIIETQIITELVTELVDAEILRLDSGKHNPHHIHAAQVSQVITTEMLGR